MSTNAVNTYDAVDGASVTTTNMIAANRPLDHDQVRGYRQ